MLAEFDTTKQQLVFPIFARAVIPQSPDRFHRFNALLRILDKKMAYVEDLRRSGRPARRSCENHVCRVIDEV